MARGPKQPQRKPHNAWGAGSALSAAGAASALAVVGAWMFLATGCSFGRQEPPDMPPFAGTDAFLAGQARIQRASAAEEAFRERYKQADSAAIERRARVFLRQQEAVADRTRILEEARERLRLRGDRDRAEEARRRYERLALANRRREDLRREREKAEGDRRRFADAEFLSNYQAREERRRAQEREDESRMSPDQLLSIPHP